jgi:cation diffusion facilitator family transporter
MIIPHMHKEKPPAVSGEKIRVARSSAIAAVFLTGTKLGIGLWTGSLGILSEAAHSGLDLIAAVMTWYSVSHSDRPADEDHPYGHYKLDNISALFETLLLLLTCVWIIYEAVERLFFKTVTVEVNVFSFAVILFAIAIDFTRARSLSRVAKKTGSAALEADALHFSSDIASSTVVLIGLAFTKLGYPQADSICSLVVAALVIWVSFRLGKKAVEVLMDKVPKDHVGIARFAAMGIPGVRHVFDVRVRHSGAKHFVDLKILVDPSAPLADVHTLTDRVEQALKDAFDEVDVVVHAEPDERQPAGLTETVFRRARQAGVGVHCLQVHSTDRGMHLDMHLEWPSEETLGEAHRKATALEEELRILFPDVTIVRSHLEGPADGFHAGRRNVTEENASLVHIIRKASLRIEGILKTMDVEVLEGEDRFFVGLTCQVDASLSLNAAHTLATHVETAVYAVSPKIASVSVHTEPSS